MAEEAKWYVAHTYSGYENKGKANRLRGYSLNNISFLREYIPKSYK